MPDAPTLDALTAAEAHLAAVSRKRGDLCHVRRWWRICGLYVCRQCYSRPEHAQEDMNARKEAAQ